MTGLLLLAPARAQETLPTVLHLLQEIESAAHSQDYTGVFTHQQGETLTSSRIVHVVDGTGERERLERLDGEPLEYLRHNDRAQCLMPKRRMVMRARARGDRFPALRMGKDTHVDQHYLLRDSTQQARVAGRECRIRQLEPRDALRYGYTLCTDTQTGLLLKVQIIHDTQVLAQTAFTSIGMGKDTLPAQLESDWNTQDWEVRDERTIGIVLEARGWRIPAPDGYQLVTELLRPMAGNRQVSQLVFSDGLAAISVFIEPMQSVPEIHGTTLRRGALSVHMTHIGEHRLTLLGDVPPLVLQTLAQRIQFVPSSAKP